MVAPLEDLTRSCPHCGGANKPAVRIRKRCCPSIEHHRGNTPLPLPALPPHCHWSPWDLLAQLAFAKIIDMGRLVELRDTRTTSVAAAILRAGGTTIPNVWKNGNERVEFKLELPPDRTLQLADPRKPGCKAQFCEGQADDVRCRAE